MGILDIRDLSLTLDGNKILHNIDIDFKKECIYALVGPNGSGKSSLAYCLMGLEGYKEIEGDILFEGESIKNMRVDERAKKGITLAWQEPARYEGLTVKQFMKAADFNKSDEEIKEALSMVALDADDYLNRAIDKTLSGGERKKIELASIVIMKPKIAMLDEPDSGIDATSLENIFEAIKMLKKSGSTVILITHSISVLKHAEDAFLMCHGRILDRGSEDKIMNYFKNKRLPCGHKNLLNGEQKD